MLRVEVQRALRAFTLQVALAVDGGCLALAGPSGAGKTSVLRIVAGLLRPEHGRIACGQATWLDTARGIDVAPEARGVGYVFQEYALFPHLSARENVAYGLRRLPRRERRRRADALLDRFGALALAGARPGALSGGERQRVALARALAPAPRALLLDEPLAALDATTRAQAARELAGALREAGVPALLVSHDFAEAALLGDRVAVLDQGRVLQQGTAAQLAATPATAFVATLTGAVVLTGLASHGHDGLTAVALDGGGTLTSTDRALGPVAATIYPWEVALEAPGASAHGSAQNRLAGRVLSVTPLGNRVRVGVAVPQPLTAELTAGAARELALGPGVPVVATFKATATRLVGR